MAVSDVVRDANFEGDYLTALLNVILLVSAGGRPAASVHQARRRGLFDSRKVKA